MMNLRPWLAAIRPNTLFISIAPIVLGQVLVWQHLGEQGALALFDIGLAVITLLCALCLQIAVNLANEYYDFQSGVDTPGRIGPARGLSSGLLSAGLIYRSYLVFLMLGVTAGLYLLWHSDGVLLLLGIVCIAAVVGYTAGPLPLAYHGLGELAVWLVFGPIAVLGGFYVQLGFITQALLWPAMAMGLLAAAVMLVNNTRDITTDLAAGKQTLAAALGRRLARHLYSVLIALSVIASSMSLDPLPRWGVLVLPVAAVLVALNYRRAGPALNRQLGQTVGFMLLLSAMLCAELLWA